MVEFCGREVLVERDPFSAKARLFVNGEGRVVVRTKLPFPDGERGIQAFVDRHRRFLNNRLAGYSRAQLPDFGEGGRVRLLGREYTVARNASAYRFSIEGDRLIVPPWFRQEDALAFLGEILLPHVKTLTELYSAAYGLSYSRIRLHARRSEWGSYSSERLIGYNVALVFVPEDCIEYVVVHELCHSLHFDHSAAFWAEVGYICPHYQEAKKRLKDYQPARLIATVE